jgi:hypothetical protein
MFIQAEKGYSNVLRWQFFFGWGLSGAYQIYRSNQGNSDIVSGTLNMAAAARRHVKELLPKSGTANIDCIHSEKKQIDL